MPSATEHLERARLNLAFAESIDLDGAHYLDWAVTAYFYAALHLIDALAAHVDNQTPADHRDRKEHFLSRWYLCGIKTDYLNLKTHSQDARYRLYPFTRIRIENVVVPLYQAIERHVMQVFKDRTSSKETR